MAIIEKLLTKLHQKNDLNSTDEKFYNEILNSLSYFLNSNIKFSVDNFIEIFFMIIVH